MLSSSLTLYNHVRFLDTFCFFGEMSLIQFCSPTVFQIIFFSISFFSTLTNSEKIYWNHHPHVFYIHQYKYILSLFQHNLRDWWVFLFNFHKFNFFVLERSIHMKSLSFRNHMLEVHFVYNVSDTWYVSEYSGSRIIPFIIHDFIELILSFS